jgi:hypothetical protein
VRPESGKKFWDSEEDSDEEKEESEGSGDQTKSLHKVNFRLI